jgi:dynein heavy chain
MPVIIIYFLLLLWLYFDRAGQAHSMDRISLGQGQGVLAERCIAKACDMGGWVVLQNCHLARSWMPQLEMLIDEMSNSRTTHPRFKLWLTSLPTPFFPVSVLQRSIKLAKTPPKGIKATVRGVYNNLLEVELQHVAKSEAVKTRKTMIKGKKMEASAFTKFQDKPRNYKRMLWSLIMFYAIVRDRRQFGALGWNIPYAFSEADLRISIDQLEDTLSTQHAASSPRAVGDVAIDDGNAVPFAAMRYLVGECNFGGRITDDKDRRCLNTLLHDFYSENILKNEHDETLRKYFMRNDGEFCSLENYCRHIETLPNDSPPEIFGLHRNAAITASLKETREFVISFKAMHATGADTSSGGSPDTSSGGEDPTKAICTRFLDSLPPLLNIQHVVNKYPITYEESMNTVLQQEVMRYNLLLNEIGHSLTDLRNALDGIIVFSDDLDQMLSALQDLQIPARWERCSYPSSKSVTGYMTDLKKRIDFISAWHVDGPPPSYWLPGFFFNQSFITGTLQNYARKHALAIDALQFTFRFACPDDEDSMASDDHSYQPLDLDDPATVRDLLKASSHNTNSVSISDRLCQRSPPDGHFIHGLFLEGAGYENKSPPPVFGLHREAGHPVCTEFSLCDSSPGELFVPLPTIWLLPRLGVTKSDSGSGKSSLRSSIVLKLGKNGEGKSKPGPSYQVQYASHFFLY